MNDDLDHECVFCGASIVGTQAAMDAGWAPSMDDSDGTEISGPVCPACLSAHCDLHESGVFILKPGHSIPK